MLTNESKVRGVGPARLAHPGGASAQRAHDQYGAGQTDWSFTAGGDGAHQRLEEQGVIEGYAARVNPGLVGRGIGAMVRIRTTHAEIKRCLHAFETMPEIVEAHRISGEDCFTVRIVVGEMAELEAAIDALASFGPVTTSVVLASYPPKAIAQAEAESNPRQ